MSFRLGIYRKSSKFSVETLMEEIKREVEETGVSSDGDTNQDLDYFVEVSYCHGFEAEIDQEKTFFCRILL